MEAELAGDLLDDPASSNLQILAVCAYALSGRHRVRPSLADRPRWERWLGDLPGDLAEEVSLAWSESERRAAVGPASERLVVRAGVSQLQHAPTEVDLDSAIALLGRPLRVLLENGRNDRCFVLAFADGATFAALVDAERHGWLVFETAGGISELRIRAAGSPPPPVDLLRTLYLCDSDARSPGVPSGDAAAVRAHLAANEKKFRRRAHWFGRVLTRRAAENYAPPRSVLAWAKVKCEGGGWQTFAAVRSPEGRARLGLELPRRPKNIRRLVAAIVLTEIAGFVREVLDMKEGRGPADNRRTADAIWAELDAFQQGALEHGFGSDFSAEFYASQRALPDETGEIVGVLSTLLERL